MIRLPGKNRLGYHAMVITGKYNTLEIIIKKCPRKDIRLSSAWVVKTENVITATALVITK
jgi:hypothetical protein